MILNREQIIAANLVTDGADSSRRATTYDATIGDIILDGATVKGDCFTLAKRGVVWVVSKEVFNFDDEHTGVATLKTTWTHKGILALNVGVIDPGWNGPLATALVNFSGTRIEIKKGDPFFRVVFCKHDATSSPEVKKKRDSYVLEIVDRSRNFSDTFLDTKSLIDEVATAVFKFPKIVVWLTVASIFVAVASIFATMARDVWSNDRKEYVERQLIERRIKIIEDKIESKPLTPANVSSSPLP